MKTRDGRNYYDFLCGAGSLNYGHNPQFIMDKVIDYLTQDKELNSLDLNTTAKTEFISDFVNKILKPRGLDYKLQFTGPTGTNAVEAALKLARKVTKRSNVIAFTNGFHGMTLGAIAATGNRSKAALSAMAQPCPTAISPIGRSKDFLERPTPSITSKKC
jgi:diaminobutyrate-2-oxoglutarate transaminase